MEIKNSAIALAYCTASQRGTGNNVCLLSESTCTDDFYIPPQEIFLTVKDIEKLYELVKDQ